MAKAGLPIKTMRCFAPFCGGVSAISASVILASAILASECEAVMHDLRLVARCRLTHFLHDPPQNHITFQAGNMIDEQHAIQMINLMLNTSRQQPASNK